MSYSVSATTATGMVSVRSGSVAEIRAAIAEARKDGASSVNLAHDGTAIDESDLSKLTTTLAASASTLTRYA